MMPAAFWYSMYSGGDDDGDSGGVSPPPWTWRDAEPVQRVHYVVEALRRAYRDRGLLGDPDFVNNPVEQLLSPVSRYGQSQPTTSTASRCSIRTSI